jgi:hypothetical protein
MMMHLWPHIVMSGCGKSGLPVIRKQHAHTRAVVDAADGLSEQRRDGNDVDLFTSGE